MPKYFFSYIDNIPETLHNTLFSPQHLLTVGMVICSWIILILLFKDKSMKVKWRLIAAASLLLPLSEMAQMVWYKSIDRFSIGYTLPLHLCSLMCVILPVMAFTRNKLLIEYSFAMGLVPAFMTLLTPDVYTYPCFSFIYIQSMLVHGTICFIPVFLIFGMGFRPDIRKLPKVIAILILFSVLITPVNYITDGNYFFLRYPAPGSPMEFFADKVGRPWYLIPTLLLGCILWAVLYSPFIIIKQKENHRVQEVRKQSKLFKTEKSSFPASAAANTVDNNF